MNSKHTENLLSPLKQQSCELDKIRGMNLVSKLFTFQCYRKSSKCTRH